MAYDKNADLIVTGQATQTVSGNNIVLATAGTGSYDKTGFRTISIQIIPTGTVSSGVVTFEGSNDGTTFVAVLLDDAASLTTNPVATVSPSTGVNRFFIGPVYWRYFRARISTVIGGGGSIAAITAFSSVPYTPDMITINQATAANLNTTVTGTVTANLAASSVVIPVPSAAQGYSTYHKAIAAATTNATSVKASAGTIGMMVLCNTSAAIKYLKLYNKASAPTVGTDVPVFSIALQPNNTLSVDVAAMGLRMSTGIAYALTGAQADADTTALTAGDVVVNMLYT